MLKPSACFCIDCYLVSGMGTCVPVISTVRCWPTVMCTTANVQVACGIRTVSVAGLLLELVYIKSGSHVAKILVFVICTIIH